MFIKNFLVFKLKELFLKFKLFCLVFFASISVIAIILILRQRLVSDDAFKMSYPELVRENKMAVEEDLAISQLGEIISSYTNDRTRGIVDVDIEGLKLAIEKLGWIEDVAVVRAFPDRIKIILKSKDIVAYKMSNDKYYPIAGQGELLNVPVEYSGGLLAFGDNVEAELPELLKFLDDYPKIKGKIVAVQLVNKLRFNLVLYNLSDGLLIKLDNDYSDGIERLAELDALQGILSRNISEIDLRDLEKILIKKRNG